MPRVRPRGEIDFHAYAVEEAISIEDHPILVEVTGMRSTGEYYRGTAEVPGAFPYLMMKLHAFSDRKQDADKDLGRHHSLDVYTIVGLMTEPEYERAKSIGAERSADPHVERARAIVREDFSAETGTGILRLREHRLFKPDFQLVNSARYCERSFLTLRDEMSTPDP
jgi:hypothetical protein